MNFNDELVCLNSPHIRLRFRFRMARITKMLNHRNWSETLCMDWMKFYNLHDAIRRNEVFNNSASTMKTFHSSPKHKFHSSASASFILNYDIMGLDFRGAHLECILLHLHSACEANNLRDLLPLFHSQMHYVR